MGKKEKEKVVDTLEQEALSPEEMEAKRKELIEFYESELPLMRIRAEYEGLVTEIEEARFNRLQIRMAQAQIMMGPSEEEMPQEMPREFREEAGPTKERKLRKTEA
jgi:hypothetical protein